MTEQELKEECHKKAIYAYGTAYLFENRANSLRWRLRTITFLSLAVPVCMGGIAMAFTKGQFVEASVLVGGILSVPLFILTLWSNVYRWEERYASSMQSMRNNNKLKNKWELLEKYAGPDFESKVNDLREQDQDQEQQDREQDISKKDERRIMRASLIQYQKTCVHCNKKPMSMKPTDCPVCGDF
jgi:mobilome CxxCx(11)CxxC protein